jgi:hypothetical protein
MREREGKRERERERDTCINKVCEVKLSLSAISAILT